MRILTKNFWDAALCKIVESFISVKVWVLISTFIFAYNLLDVAVAYEQWDLIKHSTTFISAVIGVVVVMREGFKITAVNNGNSKKVKEDSSLNV